MSNPASLKPFKKGFDSRRNSKGRPTGSTLSKLLAESLVKKVPGNGTESTYQELLIKRILHDAIEKGDFKFAQLIFNYIEGRPNLRSAKTLALELNLDPIKNEYYDKIKKSLHMVYGKKDKDNL